MSVVPVGGNPVNPVNKSNGSLITNLLIAAAAGLAIGSLALLFRSMSQTPERTGLSDLSMRSYTETMEARIANILTENREVCAEAPQFLCFGSRNSGDPKNQSKDPRIPQMWRLYQDKLKSLQEKVSLEFTSEAGIARLKDETKEQREDRERLWQREDVKQLADECQDYGIMVAYLTLEDLSQRVKAGEFSKIVDPLVSQEGYAFKTYFDGFDVYQLMRGRVLFMNGVEPLYTRLQSHKPVLPSESDGLFFQKGTVEYRWREKYNQFVRYLETTIGDQSTELRRRDQRFLNWANVDSDLPKFKVLPDTKPT